MGTQDADTLMTRPVSAASHTVGHKGETLCAKTHSPYPKAAILFLPDWHLKKNTNNKVNFLLMLKVHQNCGPFLIKIKLAMYVVYS